MSENNQSMHVGGYLAAFVIGAAMGTGIALLYAPRSGKETRELLAKKGHELKGKATDLMEGTKNFVESKKTELTAALEAGQVAMREERAKHQRTA